MLANRADGVQLISLVDNHDGTCDGDVVGSGKTSAVGVIDLPDLDPFGTALKALISAHDGTVKKLQDELLSLRRHSMTFHQQVHHEQQKFQKRPTIQQETYADQQDIEIKEENMPAEEQTTTEQSQNLQTPYDHIKESVGQVGAGTLAPPGCLGDEDGGTSSLRASSKLYPIVPACLEKLDSLNSNLGSEERAVSNWEKVFARLIDFGEKALAQMRHEWEVRDQILMQARIYNETVDLWRHRRYIQSTMGQVGQVGRSSTNSGGIGSLLKTNTRQIVKYVNDRTCSMQDRTDEALHIDRRKAVTQESLAQFIETHIVLDPYGTERIVWAVVSVILMLYDLITLPLLVFQPPESAFSVVMAWLSQVFWTCDIILSFLTAVYIKNVLTKKLRTIAKAYVTTWFPFDLTVVAPIWIVIGLGADSAAPKSVAAFRYLRMLRFLRLLRLAKLQRVLEEALQGINSPVLLLSLGIVKLMILMILLSHINACLWFGVGKLETGWTHAVESSSLLGQYLASVHWVFANFQGSSDVVPVTVCERAYAVVTLLFSLLGLACFVSSLTNQMMQIQALHKEKTYQIRAVRTYITLNRISPSLAMRMKKYVEWKQTLRDQDECKAEVLKLLPKEMLMDMDDEVRRPVLSNNEFLAAFLVIYPRLTRRIVHVCMMDIATLPGQLIFSFQEKCYRMLFITSGEVQYSFCHRSDAGMVIREDEHMIGKGMQLSEATLWMHWHHRGELTVKTHAMILALMAECFAEIVGSHPGAQASCVLYARRFITGISYKFNTAADFMANTTFIPDEVQANGLGGSLDSGSIGEASCTNSCQSA